ncbi:nuclear transport factor 2 family protein [Paracoccus sp. (in: a-proteobacteria)]|uniref:nuclear transport factor 2 family protein n=1 Tax=Paracoccus sp. TaxID=267 RepID=UPI0035B423E9
MKAFKPLLAAALLTAGLAAGPGLAQDARDTAQEEANRKLVVDFYDKVFNQHQVEEGAALLSDDYKQHNPYVPDGKEPFVSYFTQFFKDNPQARTRVVRSAADGDLVWLHNQSTQNPEDRGEAIVDIFRVTDGMIVEHWDVIQPVPETSANENTMF